MPPSAWPATVLAMDEELVEDLDGDVFVVRIVVRQLERDQRHVEREHRHPAGGVGLLQAEARRQRMRAVEHRDIVEPQEAALEDIVALGVLAVDPPGVVEQQLVEDAQQEVTVGLSRAARARCGST